ncbi:hypothetical protein [Runella aurantiaca]|nr:hypothetical protein [Runella aurantiaca]
MKKIQNWFCLLIFFLFFGTSVIAQKEVVFNLADLHRDGKLRIQNRGVTTENANNKSYIKISGGVYSGVVWLPIQDFKNGKIEIIARGKDIAQNSFYGIAFHAQNDSTFDDVYCRPFNFKAADSVRKIHAIQYVAYPKYDWPLLRKEFNGIYEKGIENPPNAEDWVTLSLLINDEEVRAFINHALKPALVVKKLNTNKSGYIGLTGFNCDVEQIRVFPEEK